MSGFFKKSVVWLGLNEEYPDDMGTPDEDPEFANPDGDSTDTAAQAPRRVGPDRPPQQQAPQQQAPQPARVNRPAVDTSRTDPLAHNASRDRSEGTVRAVPMDEEPPADVAPSGGPASRPGRQEASSGTVRAIPVPATTKPHVIVPNSFNDAQSVADKFRDGLPVIVNMQRAERDLARRLIDFSSGLCYGLGGQMEKVAKDVYLLTPTDVEVADEDRDNY